MDYAAIRRELNRQEFEYDEVAEAYTRRTYLGTVMQLVPSKKFYMPWSSTVTEDEAQVDVEWYIAVEDEMAKHGMHLTCGENDPCDLFAIEWKDAINDD